jgi:drug/metabolite transporter (DMT)-like permease
MSAPSEPGTTGGAGHLAVPWAAYASLAASMALVGSYVALSKLLVAVFPVFLLAWLRFGIAAVAMLGWLRRQPGEPPLNRGDRVLLFWESFLGNFLFSICMLFGVAATSALAAGVVMSAIPAAVALLSWLLLRERVSPRTGVAIALAIAGIALLALARTPQAGGAAPAAAPWWGYAMLLGAVVCEASYVVIGKRLTGRVSPQRISALINLWGLALVTPMGLWQALHFDFSSVSLSMWVMLVFYALAASMVTVWLWMRGLQHVPAPRAGVFTVMLPITAAVVGVVALGEPFGPLHLAALALALGGLLVATWPARAAH